MRVFFIILVILSVFYTSVSLLLKVSFVKNKTKSFIEAIRAFLKIKLGGNK